MEAGTVYPPSTNTYIRGYGIIRSSGWYYNTNYRGDVVMVTMQSGNEFTFPGYDPYGRQSAASFDFGYNGEWKDDESGLIYLRARYYDPKLARFINEDPIKSGRNWYAFCSGKLTNRKNNTAKNGLSTGILGHRHLI